MKKHTLTKEIEIETWEGSHGREHKTEHTILHCSCGFKRDIPYSSDGESMYRAIQDHKIDVLCEFLSLEFIAKDLTSFGAVTRP